MRWQSGAIVFGLYLGSTAAAANQDRISHIGNFQNGLKSSKQDISVTAVEDESCTGKQVHVPTMEVRNLRFGTLVGSDGLYE